MNAGIPTLLTVFVFAFHTMAQSVWGQHQCRYETVRVCDVSVNNGNGGTGSKGEKGDRGKAGPIGIKGERGDDGQSPDVGILITKIEQLVADMEKINETMQRPISCRTSPVAGFQTLRSGKETFCDGKWTVFQRRFNGSVDFARSWNDYKNGFGSLRGEFWLGLEKVYQLVKGRGCQLRIDIWDFDGDHAYALYNAFSIEGEDDLYRLHVARYRGTAGDSMTRSDHPADGMAFSTRDSDNDLNAKSCSTGVYGESGGWWFRSCQVGKLNAYYGSSNGAWHGNMWHEWKGASSTLAASTMKFSCG